MSEKAVSFCMWFWDISMSLLVSFSHLSSRNWFFPAPMVCSYSRGLRIGTQVRVLLCAILSEVLQGLSQDKSLNQGLSGCFPHTFSPKGAIRKICSWLWPQMPRGNKKIRSKLFLAFKKRWVFSVLLWLRFYNVFFNAVRKNDTV